MKITIRNTLYAALLFLYSFTLHATDAAKAEKIFKSLMSAQTANDYDAFVAEADDNVKTALTKAKFDAVASYMNKRTSDGYDTTSLGELNQHGYQVFLYRLRFKDGGDDILGTMSLKDDKIAGIYFK